MRVRLAAVGLVAGSGSGSSGKEGWTLNISFASFPEALDPQLDYTAEGWSAIYNTYIPLLTFAHAEGAPGGVRSSPGSPRACPRSQTAARPTR